MPLDTMLSETMLSEFLAASVQLVFVEAGQRNPPISGVPQRTILAERLGAVIHLPLDVTTRPRSWLKFLRVPATSPLCSFVR
jgi:hypothetical protein